ncbi:hypothetical protein M9Y10_001513 [Tritrichomonas musculus]|uniref:receptor protein-tyrosine kinase n=1 Tax=Tritrichomonas musculus TaxID=1915356 RepID=A0ABR2L7C4_9EUKA
MPQEILKFQEESQLLPENIDLFFQLLQQNYNINEDSIFTYIQCIDLLKISDFLEVRKLTSKIKQYIKSHKVDVDFIIQMIQYNVKTQTKTSNQQMKISSEIEQMLTSKINECFSNEKFGQLPIEIIHRVVSKSSPDLINTNKLFDIIIKSLSKYFVLFPFLDLQKLSNDRLEELCEMYSKSNENTRHYFDYLKCNLNLINEINNRKKNLQEMNDQQLNKMKDLETLLQKQLNESESKNAQLQNQLNEQQIQLNEQLNKIKDLETSFQKQLNELELKNAQLQNYPKDILIKGQIVASVEKGLFINAEINLEDNGSTLDTTKSKVIVSTSNAKTIGSEAYEDGERITSHHMNTSFACKPGKYYVRCIVFNSDDESNEIVSNSVTTNSSCLTFGYLKREPVKISLPQGQYKLEVWGAKGGDSTGNGHPNCSRGNSTVPGGLGGYSRGILSLNKKETVFVFVGEEGRASDSSDGSTTEGGFPDGGGTKTSYCSNYHTVPGTGGGSTSIRIGSDSNYTRVIVAGGGGGASGDCQNASPGGFGGGLNGGNCYYNGSLRNLGAGTQTGSTKGVSYKDNGDPGSFGLGAPSKYNSGCHSGGGGGGGWYGGGGGGYGSHFDCSGGGGGSGWTFTESNFLAFQLGDSINASKFTLTGAYYLSDVMCVGGNEEFPRPDGKGNERGHIGHGFAKITPL